MNIFYKQHPIWIKIAKVICAISFVLVLLSFVWFCVLVVDKDNEKINLESKIDILIDSHHELVEKIDELIDLLEYDINRR